MQKRSPVVIALVLFTIGALIGCAGGRKMTKVGTIIPPVSGQPYTVGPLDTIMVKVWEHPAISDSYSIDFRGTLRFPLLGEIDCLGLATYELADLLEEELRRYVRNPQVRVEVLEYNSQKVIIMGAVAKQGIYYVKSRLTIMEAIALCGGFQEGAKTTHVFIGRGETGNLQSVRVNVKNIMAKGKKDQDILLENGDIVFVPTTFITNFNKAIQPYLSTLGVYNTIEDIGN